MEKERQEKIILGKIKLVNKHYRYNISLEETGNSILPYTIKTRTETGYIVQTRSFENLEQIYYYIQGMMYILEI